MAKWLETALAHELDRSLEIELDADPAIAPLSKLERRSYTADRRVEQVDDTSQLSESELAVERNPSIRQGFQVAQTVPGVQRARHRPRMICEPVSDVKTASYGT